MRRSWLLAKIHPTWHFTAACLGVVIGVWSARWVPHTGGLTWLFTSGLLTLLWAMRPRRFMLAAALIGGVCLGVWRGSATQESVAMYDALYGKHVQIRGHIADDVETNNRGQAVAKLARVTLDARSLPGDLWVTVAAGQTVLRRSDVMTLDGRLQPGFGSFTASMTGATLVKVEREQPGDVALMVRDDFAEHVRKAIEEPAASLGIGYLLGQKSALPPHLVEALTVAGLTHIVVASGYNLTILVRLARRAFARVSKYLATLSGGVLIVGFIAMTGASPSMVRAGLVASLSMLAWYYGRKFHPVTLLALVAAATVLVNPSYAWGNLGWELSFAAFAGVMIVAPLLQAYFYGNEKPRLVPQILGETISAQLATAPIILVAFGQFSNIAILSNLIILPFIPLAMLLTFIAGLGSYALPAAAPIIGWPAEFVLRGMVAVVEWCASVPWAQSEVVFPWWGAVVWYGLIAAACWYVKWRTRYRLYEASIVE
ncbi:hypothetical protein B7Z00_05030 [Candidatus Saccharibacteria bacterium 32-50-10]|nr:MAG: hypothetical protein B7Z00_05030 [Candidatus Saccharibacteria bacterium 32-50-10]